MKSASELMEEYTDHLKVQNYSKTTIKQDTYYLNRFFLYLIEKEIEDMTGIIQETICAYQTELYQKLNDKGQPNTVATQNKALQVVKKFYRFLKERDYIICDPTKDIPYARVPKSLPKSILTKTEAKKIIKSPDTSTILGYRDRTILEVFYSSGIRKSELMNLQVSDVDYEEGFLRINKGKGGKDRVVPLGKIACRYLENYIKAARPALIKDKSNHCLFLSLSGKGLSKNTVWDLSKKYAQKSKIKKNVSPHTFRHTCATQMLKNKASIRHIQEMLGHASLVSTQVYAHVTSNDLKEVHKRCHPREKD